VEAHNFDIRKHLLEFDDVANDQRKVIYEQRNELLDEEDVVENIKAMRHDVVNEIIDSYIPPGSMDELWDIQGLSEALNRELGQNLDIAGWLEENQTLHEESLREKIIEYVDKAAEEKEKLIDAGIMRRLEKQVMLDILDRHWKDHLIAMDHLRQGIHLRSYAAKNPKQEYKREAFEMFIQMLNNIKHDVVCFLSRVKVRTAEDVEVAEHQHKRSDKMKYSHPAAPDALRSNEAGEQQAGHSPFVRGQRKIGRNEPCPCGSGRKYKHCHGKLN
jgi:preprotein translocase subunit SecA